MALSRALAVSGDERQAALVAAEQLRPLVDEVITDPLGNVQGIRRSEKPGAKTILLDAHLDEVGLIVSGYDGGMLKFCGGVGGVDPRMLPGLPVRVLTASPVDGVIGCGDPLSEDTDKPLEEGELRIDCGLTEDEAKKIPVGTRIAYATEPWQEGNRIFGKSLDDRACFIALLRALELTKDEKLGVNVILQGSVQEETGGAGAAVGTNRMRPDLAVVSDVTFGDSPDSPKSDTFPLGSGAAIGYSPVLDRNYTRRLQRLAEEKNIKYVQEVMEEGTGTNSMETQIAAGGVPSVLISLPLRYMHTPVEEIDIRDVEAVGQLTAEFLRSFDREGLQGWKC